jgi:hypothetical protein
MYTVKYNNFKSSTPLGDTLFQYQYKRGVVS